MTLFQEKVETLIEEFFDSDNEGAYGEMPVGEFFYRLFMVRVHEIACEIAALTSSMGTVIIENRNMDEQLFDTDSMFDTVSELEEIEEENNEQS